jgi:predicted nucleic acid-binding protein
MIVLDTNVVSELIRPRPDPKVLAWITARSLGDLYTSAVTRGEMMYGICVLPDGHRREQLLRVVQAIFNEDLAGRVLPYDEAAADAHARIAAQRRSIGKPGSQADMMIAGVVASRDAVLATRNGRDFSDCGIEVLDPWR